MHSNYVVERKTPSKLLETVAHSEIWATRAHSNKASAEPVVHIFSNQYYINDWESGTAGRSMMLHSVLSQHITLLSLKGSIGNGPSLFPPAESENGPETFWIVYARAHSLLATTFLGYSCLFRRKLQRRVFFLWKVHISLLWWHTSNEPCFLLHPLKLWDRSDHVCRSQSLERTAVKCFLDMAGLLHTHHSCVCLHMTGTRSSQSTLHIHGGGAHKAPPLTGGAIDSWWLLKEGESVFFRSVGPLKGWPYSRGWPHTQGHVGSIN